MEIPSQTLIYFSPTQTTLKILSAVADGTGIGITEQIDLTPPQAAKDGVKEIGRELAIIGAPVYGGRIPPEAVNRFKRVRGNESPAVVIVVYGNREYEDALLELRDIAVDAGFVPVAAGAFIGEHSLSSVVVPIAYGRPDTADLRIARSFGQRIGEKLSRLEAPFTDLPLAVPGNNPYKEHRPRTAVSPVTTAERCRRCGSCAEVCPMGAISITDDVVTNREACIRCCACIKHCPTGARVMEDAGVLKMADWLHANCGVRKEPETYFDE